MCNRAVTGRLQGAIGQELKQPPPQKMILLD
jgi:hypothetical protein